MGSLSAEGETSTSEEPSPFLETGARSKRVMFNRLGAGSAKRVTQTPIFSFPSLGSIHKSIEEMSQEQIQEEIGKDKIAKTNQASPIMQGIISKNSNGKGGSEKKLIADSGCSFPVVSDQIVKKLGIIMKPFSQPVNIIEASRIP